MLVVAYNNDALTTLFYLENKNQLMWTEVQNDSKTAGLHISVDKTDMFSVCKLSGQW